MCGLRESYDNSELKEKVDGDYLLSSDDAQYDNLHFDCFRRVSVDDYMTPRHEEDDEMRVIEQVSLPHS